MSILPMVLEPNVLSIEIVYLEVGKFQVFYFLFFWVRQPHIFSPFCIFLLL